MKTAQDILTICESLTPIEESGDQMSYQQHKDKLMKEWGYDDWGSASKDKKFMAALDKSYNAEDEAGKDGPTT
ncbi:hypothetical protein NVP1031O_183 [Vibrio phage 1.031.O._10N.261.46.F8]|nr:hypothetical protein NVP1031O_183 [Vibrio phage 1.031.O._10N.261.46.F8]